MRARDLVLSPLTGHGVSECGSELGGELKKYLGALLVRVIAFMKPCGSPVSVESKNPWERCRTLLVQCNSVPLVGTLPHATGTKSTTDRPPPPLVQVVTSTLWSCYSTIVGTCLSSGWIVDMDYG
jgi:hypothetical protein